MLVIRKNGNFRFYKTKYSTYPINNYNPLVSGQHPSQQPLEVTEWTIRIENHNYVP